MQILKQITMKTCDVRVGVVLVKTGLFKQYDMERRKNTKDTRDETRR